MSWVKDYNVVYKDKIYDKCVEIYIHKNETFKEIEIFIIDEEGKIRMIKDSAEMFFFYKKPVTVKCGD